LGVVIPGGQGTMSFCPPSFSSSCSCWQQWRIA
jgi:hypothetical protein